MDNNPLHDAIIEQRLVPCQVTPCADHNTIDLTKGHGTVRLSDEHAEKYKGWVVLNIIGGAGPEGPECWAWFARMDEKRIKEIRQRLQDG